MEKSFKKQIGENKKQGYCHEEVYIIHLFYRICKSERFALSCYSLKIIAYAESSFEVYFIDSEENGAKTYIDKLRGTQLTISTFLDNNYQDSFKDVQNYQILNECDGAVSFLPFDMSKNSFTKIDRSK